MNSQELSTVKLFVPGRLCLLGEHADWAGQYGIHPGYCLIIGTDQGIHASARSADELVVETTLPAPGTGIEQKRLFFRKRWDKQELLEAATDRNEFFRHCAGVAYQVLTRYGVGGVELRIEAMDLPLKKGVSSSAAVSITVARAFDAVYGLNLFPHELMELAYQGERMTGSQCGRMDQACIFGKTPVLLTFAGAEDVRIEPIFPEGKIEMIIVDLAGKKDTVKILSDLQKAYPRSRELQQALGPDNEDFLRRGCRAVVQGDAKSLGEVMRAAQRNFDEKITPHCPEELSSPLLHRLLALESIQENIYGGKGVGSQGDGTAQLVARSERDRDEAIGKILSAFPKMRCFPLTIYPHLNPHNQ